MKEKGRKTRLSIINDKPRKSKTGPKTLKVDTVAYQEKVERVYEYIKQGWRSNEIFAMFMAEDENLTETQFHDLLKHAYVFAENELHKDRDYVFQLHMDRYEKLYQQCMNMVNHWNQPLDPRKDWHIITAKYINAIKALISKEKLIGLHDKSMVIELNEQKAVVIESENNRVPVPGIDLERLTLEEQIELLTLIKESRTVPIEGIHRVVIKKTVIEINTETGERRPQDIITAIDQVETHDITFEEMPANVVNKFEDIPDEEEETLMPPSPVLLDSKKVIGKGKNADELQRSMQENIIEKFKQKLKQKKG